MVFEFNGVVTGQFAQRADGMVDDHPAQPTPKGRITPVLVHSPECAYKRFLGYILGQFPVIADSERNGKCLFVEFTIDFFTGMHIPAPGASQRELVEVYIKA